MLNLLTRLENGDSFLSSCRVASYIKNTSPSFTLFNVSTALSYETINAEQKFHSIDGIQGTNNLEWEGYSVCAVIYRVYTPAKIIINY